jgi:hypothetical protein
VLLFQAITAAKPLVPCYVTTPMKRRLLLSLIPALALTQALGCRLEPRAAGPAMEAVAPSFELPDHRGRTASLDRLRAEGPAVIVFYRGFW